MAYVFIPYLPRRYLVAILLGSMCHSAYAKQNIYALNLQEILNVPVSSASRTEQPQNEAAARVVVIDNQQIQLRGYVNLFDLLRDLPGFDTQAYAHETTYNQVGTRGVMGNNRYVILLDGVPIDSPATDPIALSDNFPLFDIERVEVIYGPASSIYGADAFNGVINLIPRSSGKAQVSVQLGEFGYSHISGSAQLSLTDKVTLRLAAHTHSADNPNLANAYPDIFSFTDLVRFDGSIAVPEENRAGYFGETDSSSINVSLNIENHSSLLYRRTEFSAPTTTGLRPNTVDYGAGAIWDTTLESIAARTAYSLDDALELKTMVVYQTYRVDESSKFNNIFSGFEDGFKFASAETLTGDLQLIWQPDSTHQIIAGVVMEETDAIPKTTDLSGPYNDNLPASEQPLFYLGSNKTLPARVFDINYGNVGLYGQWTYLLNSDLRLVLGARNDDNSRYGSTVSFRSGLIYQATNNLNMKLLISEAFLAPAPEFTYEHFGSFGGIQNELGLFESGFMFIPNEELAPERLENTELILDYRFDDAWQITASIYHVTVDDYILNTITQTPVSDFVDGGTIFVTANNDNVGKITSNGFDIEARYVNEQSFGNLELWANYSFLDAEFENTLTGTTMEAPFTSENKVKLGGTITVNDAFFSVNAHWIGETAVDTPQIDPSVPAENSAGSYFVINANLGVVDIVDGLDIALRVENLLDERYFNAGTGVNITFVESPQNPRQVWLRLDYAF